MQAISIYLLTGVALLGMSVLPRLLARQPLTLPSIYVVAGLVAVCLPLGLEPLQLVLDDSDTPLIEHATELMVIVSLAGAGVKLDRPFNLSEWGIGWRLLAVTMPLSIAAVAVSGHLLLGLVPASALLLGACMAPTDPVLAEDVQVSGPHEGDDGEVRFALTLEAGLNDALAFPFVYLAIAAAGATGLGGWVLEWFAWDTVYRVVCGGVVGWLAGQALGRMTPHVEDDADDSEGGEGLFVLAAILLVYGLSELVHGYGFLAVFVAAVVGKRNAAEGFNRALHRFVTQIEKLLLAGVLMAFGGMLTVQPERLLDLRVWGVAVLLIGVIRPLTGALALVGSGLPRKEVFVISAFGIRGIGSIYYLAYALRSTEFEGQELLWPVVAACILLSMVLHGVTASPAMRWLAAGGGTRS